MIFSLFKENLKKGTKNISPMENGNNLQWNLDLRDISVTVENKVPNRYNKYPWFEYFVAFSTIRLQSTIISQNWQNMAQLDKKIPPFMISLKKFQHNLWKMKFSKYYETAVF